MLRRMHRRRSHTRPGCSTRRHVEPQAERDEGLFRLERQGAGPIAIPDANSISPSVASALAAVMLPGPSELRLVCSRLARERDVAADEVVAGPIAYKAALVIFVNDDASVSAALAKRSFGVIVTPSIAQTESRYDARPRWSVLRRVAPLQPARRATAMRSSAGASPWTAAVASGRSTAAARVRSATSSTAAHRARTTAAFLRQQNQSPRPRRERISSQAADRLRCT